MNPLNATIENIKQAFGVLPPPYERFLCRNDGQIRVPSLLLYHADDLVKRNATFQVVRYVPGFLAVGDDSGGRLVVIKLDDESAAPRIVDSGGILVSEMRSLADSWSQWEGLGFPLPAE